MENTSGLDITNTRVFMCFFAWSSRAMSDLVLMRFRRAEPTGEGYGRVYIYIYIVVCFVVLYI